MVAHREQLSLGMENQGKLGPSLGPGDVPISRATVEIDFEPKSG